MRTLNLATDGREQERIKAYLEEHASEELATKINNGTPFTKDGKTLTNRKTLKGFMDYARGEAQKQTAKGAQYAMIDDEVVFGWAIHYFEEDSIDGTLYTIDGEEYKPVKKAAPVATPKPVATKKEEPAQQSMFDMLAESTVGEQAPKEDKEEHVEEQPSIEDAPKPKGSPLYQSYMAYKQQYPDTIIAMRIGDFYEVFGEDAVAIAKQLELTLTSRDCGLENRVPMVGFPYHCADRYIDKMTAIKPVAVVDEDNLRYYAAPDTMVDVETGEVTQHKSVLDDEDLLMLLRLIDKITWRP